MKTKLSGSIVWALPIAIGICFLDFETTRKEIIGKGDQDEDHTSTPQHTSTPTHIK